MASPYTQLFGHVVRNGQADVELYRPPVGIRSIVRDVLVNSITPTGNPFNLYFVSGGSNYLIVYVHLTDVTPYHLELRQVLPPDAVLRVDCNAALWSCLVTGYELTE